ncbi:MAG: hypothetical protein L3J69_13385 [Desulfobacula sp.]|nr:hypothetical protein [Desulfobacula sp.]
MPTINTELSKDIAWNGISLKVPFSWDIDSLDANHMLIGSDGAPEIEIKWTDAPKRFTLEKYLKKFISQSQKHLHIKIHELPAPKSFSHPSQALEFFFFSWESKTSKGNGTLIFCSLCKRLTMVRFFFDVLNPYNALHSNILSSFSDHSVSGQMQWQLFGLAFSTPDFLKLIEYSFKPGFYIIHLNHKKTTLKVFSWGPASFLISKLSLCEFAMERLPQLKGFAKAGICKRGNCLEWTYRHGRFKNAETLPFIKRFSSFAKFRICHDQKANRILGVMVNSHDNYDQELIKGSMIGDT